MNSPVAAPDSAKEVLRRDYQSAPFLVDQVELSFLLEEKRTTLDARLELRRAGTDRDCFLNGENLELLEIRVDGSTLSEDGYQRTANGILLLNVPDTFVLETKVCLRPQDNTQLSGLYRSGSLWCTQCEAEGFRRICFYPDRPDVLAKWRVKLTASESVCPVLLSNGNLLDSGSCGEGLHFALWEDPHPKPSYLFALVAGSLSRIQDSFETASGASVELAIWSEPENKSQLSWAMQCLQSAMRWDEMRYGREYDLSVYNIVAVGDFNSGAMENKGLNLFNTAYVLADSESATDGDYEAIDGVIAHEYFHNWTGNRVTCQDWFQLTLKEGLTVFRDQQYSSDQCSEAVKRIEDVRLLQSMQFAEDAGPTAHPIRPDSYVAMDNFYTSTVYNKGAEVIRMFHSLLGEVGFRKGMDLYFDRHDGCAVTCDDFRAAMADANEVNLDQFEAWYSQAGTPVVAGKGVWDEAENHYVLRLSQSCPATPGQKEKRAFPIPVSVALLSAEDGKVLDSRVCSLNEKEQVFSFEQIRERPVLSLLRGFSAPVRLQIERDDQELATLLAVDEDPFARWDVGQELGRRLLFRRLAGETSDLNSIVAAFRTTLQEDSGEDSLRAQILTLPAANVLAQDLHPLDPVALVAARRSLRGEIAKLLQEEFLATWMGASPTQAWVLNSSENGRRRLRNVCLGWLAAADPVGAAKLAAEQYQNADNMTEGLGALQVLAWIGGDAGAAALQDFRTKWDHNPLVLNKWFAVQAGADRDDVLNRVEELLQDPSFDLRNPNKVYSLIRVFCRNLAGFHGRDFCSYAWYADMLLKLDALNPQVAGRLASGFRDWESMVPDRRQAMRAQLERLAAAKLSRNLEEIVDLNLGGASA